MWQYWARIHVGCMLLLPKHAQICYVQSTQFRDQSYSPLIPFPKSKNLLFTSPSNSQDSQTQRSNAPIFLQKFGHCRLENPPRKRPQKGMRAPTLIWWVHPKQTPAVAQTVLILLMFSCLAIVSGSESFCPYDCWGGSDDVLEKVFI